ncbi:MAG: ketopantoate reductase family protein, partial [Sphingomonas sp.]
MKRPEIKTILILGASYGLLPGAKLSLAGHAVTLVGRGDEIAIMAKTSLEVRITPRRPGDDIVLRVPVAARAAGGHIALATPDAIDPSSFDFVILAMQEPQYSDSAVAALMARIAASARPCLSIMNLAPP